MPKNITREVLRSEGFERGGVASFDPAAGRHRACVTWKGQGFAVYLMVMDGEVKKAGQTGKGGATFQKRMDQSFSCLLPTIDAIRAGRLVRVGECLYHGRGGVANQPLEPYEEDFPWKHRVPFLTAEQVVDLWVKEFPHLPDEDDAAFTRRLGDYEASLNKAYCGEWAAQGWTRRRKRDCPRRILVPVGDTSS